MKVANIVKSTSGKQYNAQIMFGARGATRKTSWTTTAVFKKHGYTVVPLVNTNGRDEEFSKRIWPHMRKVEFSGSRDEIIKQRKEINQVLRVLSGGAINAHFSHKEKVDD